jgi:hypothetical protein
MSGLFHNIIPFNFPSVRQMTGLQAKRLAARTSSQSISFTKNKL